MRWYAISGSWKHVNDDVRRDVEKTVKRIVSDGNGIITGGALGVDYIATQTVLENGNPKSQLKIYLPIKLDALCNHFFKRAEEGVISREQAEMVTEQLRRVKRLAPHAISDDWGWEEANKESYYGRNTLIIRDCEELYAFQVNESKGTQDAIDKAETLGKPAHVKKYRIEYNNKL